VFVGRVVPTATVVAADGGVAVHDLGLLPRRGVVAVAGVARPERFWDLLARLGVEVVERLRFPDHHPYAARDLARIREAAAGRGRVVVTTEKDLVKLARFEDGDALGLYALRIEVAIEAGERLVDVLLAPP
jgi:tetraacyldisaccharide 4'-kinase